MKNIFNYPLKPKWNGKVGMWGVTKRNPKHELKWYNTYEQAVKAYLENGKTDNI